MSNTALTLNSKVVQNEGNFVSDMDGEKVMLNIARGKYYNLGELGGAIWEDISSPIEVKEIINQLLSQYEVDQTTCEQQVMAFVKSLSEEQLIRVENEG